MNPGKIVWRKWRKCWGVGGGKKEKKEGEAEEGGVGARDDIKFCLVSGYQVVCKGNKRPLMLEGAYLEV